MIVALHDMFGCKIYGFARPSDKVEIKSVMLIVYKSNLMQFLTIAYFVFVFCF